MCVVVLKPDLDSKHTNSSVVGGRFPSFFTFESQFSCPYSIQNAVQGAKLIQAALESGLESGLLIAVPIPKVRVSAHVYLAGMVGMAKIGRAHV